MAFVANKPIKNIMTFDLEEWFHILDLPDNPNSELRTKTVYRAEQGLEIFLELIERHHITCTFFVLGWLAERNPGIIRKIDTSRHEIASHGYGHEMITSLKPEEFREDISRAKKILEDLTGREVNGYRGPGFSITEKNMWAFDCISEAGYSYDATLYPGKHGHGGISGMPIHPFFLVTHNGNRLEEYPVSLMTFGAFRMAFSGGGYFRLLPAFFISACFRLLNAKRIPVCSYFHPRDLDINVPRLPMPAYRRFKCYVNIAKTHGKLTQIMKAHNFCSVNDWRREKNLLPEISLVKRPFSPQGGK